MGISMNRKTLFLSVFFIMILLSASSAFALTDTNSSGSNLLKDMGDSVDSLQATLLNYPVKIAAFLGIVFSIFQAFTGAGYKVVISWLTVSIMVSMLPKIMNALFANGILTP